MLDELRWTGRGRRTGGLAAMAILACSPLAAKAADVSIAPGHAVTFRLAGIGADLVPRSVRNAPIGDPDAKAGEITVGLAPAGNAVRMARLHVFERTAEPIRFRAVAYRGTRTLDSQTLCGPLEIDFWTTFPAGTNRVVLINFAKQQGACP